MVRNLINCNCRGKMDLQFVVEPFFLDVLQLEFDVLALACGCFYWPLRVVLFAKAFSWRSKHFFSRLLLLLQCPLGSHLSHLPISMVSLNVFFLVYHYFFFFNVSVRKRLYGYYYARRHDLKWDVSPPRWGRLSFSVRVMVAHWLAALEGPELHRIPGGWSNVGVWGLIVVTLLMQYSSTLYLAKYSEKVVVPTAVVQFGPYRRVRHSVYASTMMLFATYFVALRAPLSLLFLVAVCVLYYDQKAKLEEALMIETFGERYMEYISKVRYKFIPFIY